MRYEYYSITTEVCIAFVKIQLGCTGMNKLVLMQWMMRIESELNSN